MAAPVKPKPPPKQPGGPIQLDCLPNNAFIRFLFGKSIRDMLRAAGVVDAAGAWIWITKLEDWARKEGTWKSELILNIVKAFSGVVDGQMWLIDNLGRAAAKASGCPTPDVTVAAVVQLILGAIERWVAEIPPGLKLPWDYFTGWTCPVEVPSADWCNSALATNSISYNDWRCLVRLNGQTEKWQAADANMRQNRPTDEDLLLLLRKGWITDEQYAGTMSRLGWTNPDMRNMWEYARLWTPSPQDAIDWMIKDVEDKVIQNTFGLGQEFNLKYAGDVEAVFKANGVTQKYANNIWRAHWRNISPHELYTMHKRLRPGAFDTVSDPDVLAFAQSIAPRRPRGPGADAEIKARQDFYGNVPIWLDQMVNAANARAYLSAIVTESFHLYEALGQADYPPFWRDRLAAISYNVMTRTDARRAYEIGAIDENRLYAILLDEGSAPQDARALVAFYKQNYILAFTRKPVANQWVSQGYSQALLSRALQEQGLRPELVPDVLGRLQTRRAIYVQQKCLAQWKKDFIRRLYVPDEIRPKLMQAGLNFAEANDLINAWTCESAAAHRQARAAELGNEYVTGVITEAQYRQSLTELKYRTKEIRRMVTLRKLQPKPKKWGVAQAPEPLQLPNDE